MKKTFSLKGWRSVNVVSIIWEALHINPDCHSFSPCAGSKNWVVMHFLGSPAVVPSAIPGSPCPWEKPGISKANDCRSSQQPTEAQTNYDFPQFCRQVRVSHGFSGNLRSEKGTHSLLFVLSQEIVYFGFR